MNSESLPNQPQQISIDQQNEIVLEDAPIGTGSNLNSNIQSSTEINIHPQFFNVSPANREEEYIRVSQNIRKRRKTYLLIKISLQSLQCLICAIFLTKSSGFCENSEEQEKEESRKSITAWMSVFMVYTICAISSRLWALKRTDRVSYITGNHALVVIVLEIFFIALCICGLSLFILYRECFKGKWLLTALFILLLITSGMLLIHYVAALVIIVRYLPSFLLYISIERNAGRDRDTEISSALGDNLMKALKKISYHPDIFTKSKECSICIGEFKIGESVISLPCDPRHYFHSQCIGLWLKKKDGCPICRKKITEKMISDSIDQDIVEDRQ